LKRLALTLALALVATSTSVALATTVLDRQDVTSGLDLAKVSGTYNRATDQIVQTIDFYNAVPKAPSVKGRPPSSVCVEIWTRSTPGESTPDYEACASALPGKGWAGSIARKRLLGPQKRLGAVRIEFPSATRMVLRVKPADIRRPTLFRWRVEATDFGSDCKSAQGCADYAPDRPGTATTKLGKPPS
jgi:hypothetical protein